MLYFTLSLTLYLIYKFLYTTFLYPRFFSPLHNIPGPPLGDPIFGQPARYREADLHEIAAAALPGFARHISLFPSLRLAVKRVRITTRHRASAAEGQTLWALRQFLPEVPVPEVYGWRRDGDMLFVFMELIEGETLHNGWKELSEHEKAQLCAQLRRCGANNHFTFRLKESLWAVFLPFPDPEAFYEFLMQMPSSERDTAHNLGLPHLPYDSPIVFTHGDLSFSNIMITPRSAPGPARVLAIIDWEQSGWMPDFWEYCKPRIWMMSLPEEETGDMIKKLPEIMGEVPEEVFMAYATYVQSYGGF
ncbi:hypothetical protein NLJ89_g5317 [Agrocybe chaxingu]|uniref:Aminoglycoside phosphotransferase domain-containing protein n=1 Tax=Agrocybe chaxingu TaxID=84603 RepID=A0A9W8K117_9AGAR|nr:hypothetical protein NLJ89_g5317 [Agrocybe chaxingu]